MPGAPNSFLFLVVRPGAPSSVLAPINTLGFTDFPRPGEIGCQLGESCNALPVAFAELELYYTILSEYHVRMPGTTFIITAPGRHV